MPDPNSDLDLVRGVAAGDGAAWAAFVARTADAVYRVVARYYDGPARDRETAGVFADLRAGGAAALADYDGRAPLADFLALKADAAMGRRLAAAFRVRRTEAWPAFERRFGREIRRFIARFFDLGAGSPRAAALGGVDDLYQEFALGLIERGFAPLADFQGSGSAGFSWFVKHRVLQRWCIDRGRAPEAGGRWRPPEAIEALPELDRRIFEAMDRRRLGEEEVRRAFPEVPRAEISEALDRIYAAHAPGSRERVRFVDLRVVNPDGDSAQRQIAADAPGAESALIDGERQRALAEAIRSLPEEDRLILRLWFEHDDFAQVARLSGRPIAEVRRIRERAQRRLKALLENGAAPAENSDPVRLHQEGTP